MELPKIHAFGSPTVDSAPVLILILVVVLIVVLVLILAVLILVLVPAVVLIVVLVLILVLVPAVVLILILIAHHTETSFPIAVRPYYGPAESGLYKNFVPPPEYFPVA